MQAAGQRIEELVLDVVSSRVILCFVDCEDALDSLAIQNLRHVDEVALAKARALLAIFVNGSEQRNMTKRETLTRAAFGSTRTPDLCSGIAFSEGSSRRSSCGSSSALCGRGLSMARLTLAS